jgi:hypothetical protein
MFYYYNIDRTIKRSIADFILPEDGQNRVETVEIEIFARVEFTKAPTGSKITRMTGHWFDLNGNTSRLFAMLDRKTIAQIRKEEFKRLKLAQEPIHQKHYDADMGIINFNRGNS